MSEETFIVLPEEVRDKISEKFSTWSYTTNYKKKQLNYVTFDFGEFTLGITLDCSWCKHSMKFVVVTKSEQE